jgi:hypothetical protein
LEEQKTWRCNYYYELPEKVSWKTSVKREKKSTAELCAEIHPKAKKASLEKAARLLPLLEQLVGLEALSVEMFDESETSFEDGI